MTTTSAFVLWAVFGLLFGSMVSYAWVVIREAHRERERVEAHRLAEMPKEIECPLCGETMETTEWHWRHSSANPEAWNGLRCPDCSERLRRSRQVEADKEAAALRADFRARMEAVGCWDLTQDAGGGPA